MSTTTSSKSMGHSDAQHVSHNIRYKMTDDLGNVDRGLDAMTDEVIHGLKHITISNGSQSIAGPGKPLLPATDLLFLHPRGLASNVASPFPGFKVNGGLSGAESSATTTDGDSYTLQRVIKAPVPYAQRKLSTKRTISSRDPRRLYLKTVAAQARKRVFDALDAEDSDTEAEPTEERRRKKAKAVSIRARPAAGMAQLTRGFSKIIISPAASSPTVDLFSPILMAHVNDVACDAFCGFKKRLLGYVSRDPRV